MKTGIKCKVGLKYQQECTNGMFAKVKVFYNRYAKVITVLALACILSVSGVLIAKLNTDYTGGKWTLDKIDKQETVSSKQTDFEYLVKKYIDYFVPNENGTVSIDMSKQVRTQSIEVQDQKALQEYSNMLDNINRLVEEGALYIADDGNYYIADKESRINILDYLKEGKNTFYVKTTTILWVNIPTGYYLALNNYLASILALGLQVLSDASVSMFLNGMNFDAWIKSVLGFEVFSNPKWESFLEAVGLDNLKNALQKLDNGDFSLISTILNLPIFGNIIKTIVGILSIYVNNRVGIPFKNKSKDNFINGNNTVEMNSDLLLLFPSIVGRYF